MLLKTLRSFSEEDRVKFVDSLSPSDKEALFRAMDEEVEELLSCLEDVTEELNR